MGTLTPAVSIRTMNRRSRLLEAPSLRIRYNISMNRRGGIVVGSFNVCIAQFEDRVTFLALSNMTPFRRSLWHMLLLPSRRTAWRLAGRKAAGRALYLTHRRRRRRDFSDISVRMSGSLPTRFATHDVRLRCGTTTPPRFHTRFTLQPAAPAPLKYGWQGAMQAGRYHCRAAATSLVSARVSRRKKSWRRPVPNAQHTAARAWQQF